MARTKREAYQVPEGTKMVQIQVSVRADPKQIEDFPPECARSVRGALHFQGGGTFQLTSDELEHIRAKHTAYARLLQPIPTRPVVAPSAAPSVAEEADAGSDGAPTSSRGIPHQRDGKKPR